MKSIGTTVLAVVCAAVLAACNGGSGGDKRATPTQVDTTEVCGTESGEGCAPSSERVDLGQPSFSDPTNITNPLFPISDLQSVLLLGNVEGEPFRTEVTLLPETKVIEWNGQQVETLVSQYVAFLDGRIEEVALDFYAQADDGSVWYFGEDVFNYADGVVADTEGTWLAGKDGPAAMIMPADPQAGDVYRPENAPGFVFEEVTVKRIGETVDGPRGPVAGAIVVEELHMDGTLEDKTFAPGYGEFFTGGGGDVEALALAVPADALSETLPAELETLLTGTTDIIAAAEAGDWDAASSALDGMNAAWETLQAGGVPPLVDAQMSDSLDALAEAVAGQAAPDARQTAIGVAHLTLDLQLRHRPVAEIDLARFDLWARQLLVDAAADDTAGVTGDVTVLEWVRNRIAHTLDSANMSSIDATLDELRAAADNEDLTAAADAAGRLRDILAGLP